MPYVLPSDTHVTTDTGHTSDHNNIVDVLTALGYAWLPGYWAPSGATAETFPRVLISTGSSALVSGTLYVQAVGMKQNTVVNNITFATKGTAESGGTHAWYVLLDSNLIVRAVTADQTGATALGAVNTHFTFATNAYTTSYSGLYYLGICVVATTMPVMAVAAGASATPADVVALAPILCGFSSTAQTSPPATGSTMAALSAAGGYTFYAYTS